MVVALTATLMVGVLAIAAAIVITVSRDPAPALTEGAELAREIALPAGEDLLAATISGGVLTIATKGSDGKERLYLYDATTGAQLGTTEIQRD